MPYRARLNNEDRDPNAFGPPADADALSITALTLALTPRGLAGLLGSTVQAGLNDRGASMGAALAYYTLCFQWHRCC